MEHKVTKWLKDNTSLSWTRTGGDEPPVKLDRLYINRSEGYEIRDFILKYYDLCDLAHNHDNYSITFQKIKSYKSNQKVKTQEMLDHLASTLKSDTE